MRTPNYEENLAALEGLAFTIKTILDYGRNIFKARGLVTISKKRDGHCFITHLIHLVEAGYLSTEKTSSSHYAYSVNDWNSLRGYHNLISLLLSPPDDIEEKFSTVNL